MTNVPLHAASCALNSNISFSAKNPSTNLSLQSILLLVFVECFVHLASFVRKRSQILLQLPAAAFKFSLLVFCRPSSPSVVLICVLSRDANISQIELRSSTTGSIFLSADLILLKSSYNSLVLCKAAVTTPTIALPVVRASMVEDRYRVFVSPFTIDQK